MAPLTSPPKLAWASLQAKLEAEWEPGMHVTVIAPTGHGKTHLALELAELCRYVLVLSTKRKDPLVADLEARGYLVVSRPDQILWTETEPVRRKIVFWPRFPERFTVRQRLAAQARAMQEVMDYADKTGGWAIVADETMWLHDSLGLERELNAIWHQGRTQGLSLIACAQRPSRVPRLAFSQASYLFIGKYNDKRDIETLREISSAIPKEVIENGIRSLSKAEHEFLYVDTARDEVAIVVAPPR